MKLRFCIIFFLLILASMDAFAVDRFQVNVTESGKVISYYDQYWVVQVNGTVTLHNPFNNSFDLAKFGFDLGPLTIIEGNDTDFIRSGAFIIPYIEAHQTIDIGYTIRGISAYDPMTDNHSVMYSALKKGDTDLIATLISNIMKSDVENHTLDTGLVKSSKNRRLIVVTLDNPAYVSQNVTSIKVIKTPEQDPNNELESWYFGGGDGPVIIPPRDRWTEDIIDYNSSEGEVYWLSSDVHTYSYPPLIVDRSSVLLFDQNDLYQAENGSIVENEQLSNITEYLEHLMYIKKRVSTTVLFPGDFVTVTLNINNFAPIARSFNLTEMVPHGFEVEDSGGANATSVSRLFWNTRVNRDANMVLKYRLKFVDNESLGLDYFEPARLDYENQTLYSERIAFIRQYIPEKKIFIQKKLSYGIDNQINVQLQLQNLGESDIQGLYVKEFLGADDVFSEISVAPVDKGRWEVPKLKRGEMWEVTYVTDENPNVNLLPEVYGVDNKVVLKTLVFENVIRNSWLAPTTQAIEILAPLFILAFIIAYLVYIRRVHTKKTRGIRSMESRIHKLKKDTSLKPEESISLLQRESATRKDISTPGGYDISGHSSLRKPPNEQAHENIEKLKHIEEDTETK